MSHFITLVFTKKNGKSVEELLAPFNENIEYAPYVKYTKKDAVAKIREEIEKYKNTTYTEYLKDPKKYKKNFGCNKAHIHYIEKKFPKIMNWTDEECYREMRERFEEDMIKPNGDLLSTYNPNSKWDWYSIGGRWDGWLETLSGQEVNTANLEEINWNGKIPFVFITPIGEWCEKGEMGYFGMTFNEKVGTDWETEFKDFLDSLNENDGIRVTVVDCHI